MSAFDALRGRVDERMSAIAAAGLMRSLRAPAGVDFSSNDYLALSAHPLLVERMRAAVAREGCGSTGSRLLRGERQAFDAIEQRFAAFKGTDRSLYFSSGYLANIAVLTAFAEPGDVIFSDALNHASLIDGVRLSSARRVVFPHNDVEALTRLLNEPRGPDSRAFVVVESLFSMDGDEAPLAEYARLCRDTGTALIVDEAHAVGVYGTAGSGLIEASGTGADIFVSVNTAGKALGVSGAFAAGPAWAIEYLVQRARPFVFSTAPPPAVCDALDASLDVIAGEPGRRARLHELSRRLRSELTGAGVVVPPGASQIVPVMLGDNDRAVAVARTMQAHGFDVRPIRPPTVPAGTARLRVAVNVGLGDETIDRFVTALAAAVHESSRCLAVSS